MKQMLLGILISFCFTITSDADTITAADNYRQLLNSFYLQDKETCEFSRGNGCCSNRDQSS